MKKYIKEIYNETDHDGFMFILDEKDRLDISPFSYKNPSDPIESHELGLKYHIITYKETADGEFIDPDLFEAILGDPHHYVSNLIKAGFFGTICKKTKHSFEIVNDMFDDLLDTIDEQDYEEYDEIKT